MCGICGYVGDHRPEILEPMCSTMAHRGPDDAGTWHDANGRVGLGHRRLSIIDLMMFLVGAPVVRVIATRIGESPAVAVREDKMTITLTFADGSLGTLHYFGNGHKRYPKETLEVCGDGKCLRLDNFRVLTGYGHGGFSKMKLRRMDKGHAEEFKRFVDAVARGGPPVIPFDEIENVMRATFAAVESSRTGDSVAVV